MGKIKTSFTSAIFILLALSLIIACSRPSLQKTQASGVYHLVKKNETVQVIARAYGVSLQKLVKTNNITDVDSVKEGSVIFIPSSNRVIDNVVTDVKVKNSEKYSSDNVKEPVKNQDIKELKPEKETSAVTHKKEAIPVTQYPRQQQSKIAVDEKPSAKTIQNKKSSDEIITVKPKEPVPDKKMNAGKNRFIWPVQGDVNAHFGVQPNKTFHNWIKIISTAGKKVKAAESGTVIFSSRIKNYGETIIVRHKDNYATVYTHLKKRNIKIDQNVKKGEAIAVLGEKDDAGKVYMNFEIRLQGKARNPLLFLP